MVPLESELGGQPARDHSDGRAIADEERRALNSAIAALTPEQSDQMRKATLDEEAAAAAAADA